MHSDLPTLVATESLGNPRRRRDRQRQKASWGLSAAVHGFVAVVVVVEVMLALLFVVPAAAGRHDIELAVANEPIELAAEPLATLPIESSADPTAAAVAEEQISELAAADITTELARQLLNPDSAGDDREASDWVLARVTQEIVTAEKLSREEQYQKLEQLTGTLNAVGTEPGVEEATAQLAKLLSTKPRATEPAKEPPPGEFDIDSAQLYDIKRTDNGRGSFTYAAVLLDAEGRTLESELTEAEGEQLFRTFELMKANPLLARVYRGVVMGLLDKLLRPAPDQK